MSEKVIAITPVKNEAWILSTYLSNVLPIVDEIIVIDDHSTDNSVEILKQHDKVRIFKNEEVLESGWPEYNIRMRLLELARESKAEYICGIDADETFSSTFLPIAKRVMQKLEPGQKILMQWVALWKTVDFMRDDQSVWSNNFKDFIFRDDGKIEHEKSTASIGLSRTPGLTDINVNCLKLKPEHGAVLHYQFSHWRNFQLKQAWYRCSELITMPGNEAAINQKYSITLDDPNTFVREIPEAWKKGIVQPDLANLPVSWHLEKIREFFDQYGSDYFKNLNIFHVKEIKELINKNG